jgi:hypothetical protein
MNQKSSLREVPQLVSWVLTGNMWYLSDLLILTANVGYEG